MPAGKKLVKTTPSMFTAAPGRRERNKLASTEELLLLSALECSKLHTTHGQDYATKIVETAHTGEFLA